MLYLTAYFPITSPTLIFFVVLIIILFAPIIMGKLRIPHIIGMVLAGMVIGQNGLDILTRDSSFELFGKVGLLYIMFLAGLEMDLESVKKNSRRFLIFGLLTCLIPLILTYTMSRWLLDYSHTASFLLGCIMASNTLIAYPIISRYGLQRNSSVMLSVGSSMLSLFLALMMLAALSAAYDEDTGFVFWIMFLIKFAAFLALLGWSIPKLARYFLRRYSDAVMQYIFVLSVMFLSAALSEAIGVEGIVGAFLAGLILNRYIPHVSPLMNRIEFIGNALFIPYFLIGVGMLINVHSLFEGFHMLWIVTLIAFFGTFGKALAAYLSSLLFRLPKAAGNMMFGLTCAHAAGAIAMVMVGMNLEVSPGVYLVNNEMLNGVVIMILITCIISTMVTDHASQQIILASRQENTGSPTPNADDEKIMLCVKYPEIAPQLLELAIMMRNEKLNRGLVALNVVYDDALSSKHQEQGQQLLERLQQRAAASDIQMQTQVRLASNIANGIKHAFREFGASEIMIVLTRFVQPLNTLRRIQVAVPSRAEFEPGFHRWLERLSRMASNLDCRIQFHGRNESMELIREYINNHHPSVRAEYTYMAHWNELPKLAANISDDHMFVVITARKGTISYKSALERLPNELRQHFSGKNLMILFPDQYGDAKEESMTFTAAQHQEESSVYDTISRWINHHRTKKHNSH